MWVLTYEIEKIKPAINKGIISDLKWIKAKNKDEAIIDVFIPHFCKTNPRKKNSSIIGAKNIIGTANNIISNRFIWILLLMMYSIYFGKINDNWSSVKEAKPVLKAYSIIVMTKIDCNSI